jgi:DNA primase
MKTTGRNAFEAARFIMQKQPSDQDLFDQALEVLMDEKPEFREFSSEVLGNLWNGMQEPGNPGRAYLRGRGFSDDTIDYFKVGYSAKKDMVAVPMHSPDGIPVGVVGRSIAGKIFKNSVGLPTSKTFFNLHRAKRVGGTVIVTESSFDTMAVHQAGYPNAVGNLGGHMSPQKLYLLNRYFDKIVLFLDDDESGHKLAQKIANRFQNSKDVMYAHNTLGDDWYIYGCKDASEILERGEEYDIKAMIMDAIPVWEYNSFVVQ